MAVRLIKNNFRVSLRKLSVDKRGAGPEVGSGLQMGSSQYSFPQGKPDVGKLHVDWGRLSPR